MENKLKSIATGINTYVAALLAILSLLVIVFGFTAYVRSIVSDMTSDSKFIQSVASHVRPSVIFDSNGVILADQGAMQFISKLDVVPLKKTSDSDSKVVYPTKSIRITPNVLLKSPPILEIIDPSIIMEINQYRGKGYEWIADVEWQLITEKQENQAIRFRLEIIR